MALKMSLEELNKFLVEQFPQVSDDFVVESVAENTASVRMYVSDKNLRPGGTVSGPSMFALADVSIYLAIMAMVGPKALAVTTNCSIDFMNKPAANTDLLAEARILKLGKVLVVGDVLIHSDGREVPVARASLTYSIPPSR